jgi:hypothetical protein
MGKGALGAPERPTIPHFNPGSQEKSDKTYSHFPSAMNRQKRKPDRLTPVGALTPNPKPRFGLAWQSPIGSISDIVT